MISKTIQRSLSVTVRNPIKMTKKAKIPTMVQTQNTAHRAAPVRDFHANAIKLESSLAGNQSQSATRFPFFRNKVVGN